MPGPLIGLGMGTMGSAIGASAAGAGAAAGGGIPLSVIIPVIISLLGELFGKEEDPLERAMEMREGLDVMGMKPPYQSPYLPQMSEAAMRAVLGQLGRTQNWGWPADKGLDTGWIQEMMQSLPTGTGGVRRRLPA